MLNRNRNQTIAQNVATILLNAEVGDRFSRMSDLQDKYQVGAGTIQKAIQSIETNGGVVLRRAGHQGTHIEALDLSILWKISGKAPLVGVFPKFSAFEMQEARSLLRSRFAKFSIPFSTVERAGGQARVKMVLEQEVDFTLISKGLIGLIETKDSDQLQFVQFEEGTYYRPNSVVNLYRAGFDPYTPSRDCRTGIDPKSNDHFHFSKAEFEGLNETNSIECDYLDIPKLILEDKIDRAVWHQIETIIPLDLVGLHSAPLRQFKSRKLLAEYSSMVLICRQEDKFLATIADSQTYPSELTK